MRFQISEYAQSKLYKAIGPIVVGIELIRLRGEEYRPYFSCYSLWGEGKYWTFLLSLYGLNDRKGLQFSIPYKDHDRYFDEPVECVKAQFPIPFNRDVLLVELFTSINTFSKTLPWSAAPNSYFQAVFQEVKFIQHYIGSSLKINAGSYLVLINANPAYPDTTYYFGCSDNKCKKFFWV